MGNDCVALLQRVKLTVESCICKTNSALSACRKNVPEPSRKTIISVNNNGNQGMSDVNPNFQKKLAPKIAKRVVPLEIRYVCMDV